MTEFLKPYQNHLSPGFLITFFPRVSIQKETKWTGSASRVSCCSWEENILQPLEGSIWTGTASLLGSVCTGVQTCKLQWDSDSNSNHAHMPFFWGLGRGWKNKGKRVEERAPWLSFSIIHSTSIYWASIICKAEDKPRLTWLKSFLAKWLWTNNISIYLMLTICQAPWKH